MEQRKLQHQIERDLYHSFRFSQGSFSLQDCFISLSVDHYRKQSGTGILLDIVELCQQPTALESVAQIPRSHRHEFSKDDIATEFRSARRLLLIAARESEKHDINDTQHAAVEEMIIYDIHYQQERRTMDADPHASYFREFVLLGKPTPSASFNAIFTGMRAWQAQHAAAGPACADMTLEKLEAAWNSKHPGQDFASAVYGEPDALPSQ